MSKISSERLFYQKIYDPLEKKEEIPDDEINRRLNEIYETLKKEGNPGDLDEQKWSADVSNFKAYLTDRNSNEFKLCLKQLSNHITSFPTLSLKNLVEKAKLEENVLKGKNAIVLIAPTG